MEGDRGGTVVKVICYKSKVAGSIPVSGIEIFIDITFFRPQYGPGVD